MVIDPGNKRLEHFLKFSIALVCIVLLNMLAQRTFFRIDLTEDKRFTIKEPTKELLRQIDDVVYVEVYLEGEFPAEFVPLQRTIRETLEEFRVYAGNKLQYKFVNPALAVSDKSRNEFYQFLGEAGIQPTNTIKNVDGNRSEVLIFPGAIVSYGGLQTGVMLFKGNRGAPYLERINQSIEGVEYELAAAIRSLLETERARVAFIRGQGELQGDDIAGLNNILVQRYDVFNVDLKQKQSLLGFNVAIVAKPKEAFSEHDKYKLDQFLMNGGNLIFFLDALHVSIDSAQGDGTFAVPYELNLTDLLFKYGLRINQNYILDLNSGMYPVVAGFAGDQPQIRLLPWPFFPVINLFTEHPIVRNLDAVTVRFGSSLDTVKAEGVLKTPLFFTSQYSNVVSSPVKVSFNDFRKPPEPEFFNQGPQPMAYLLEGKFTSLFENRILPEPVDKSNFRQSAIGNGKVLVVADGDFVRNEINVNTDRPLQLGYDQFTRETFANEDFVLNAMAYLLDGTGLIRARSKKIEIRPLDKIKVQQQRAYWQALNIGLPLVLLAAFGLVKYYLRKRRYANF